VIAHGPPAEVLTAPVLEATFGAGLDVLNHLGMPVVVDSGRGAPATGELLDPHAGLPAAAAGPGGGTDD